MTELSEEVLLKILDMTQDSFGRFCCAWMETPYKDNTKCIVVKAHIGGDNIDDYKDEFNRISRHPWYFGWMEDDMDYTYVYFEFVIPREISDNITFLN